MDSQFILSQKLRYEHFRDETLRRTLPPEQNIDFIMYKQQFYQDVLDGKREYHSNLTAD